jgi:hypothetical protein
MSWPRAVLLSTGPAILGFGLSYLNPWLGIGVLSTDILLGIVATDAPATDEPGLPDDGQAHVMS